MLLNCRISLLIFIVFLCFSARAQNEGWDHVRNNNFVAAKAAFEANLGKNPQDEAALTGLAFISETLQDYEKYQKNTNQLITSGWAAPYFWLFGHLYSGTAEEALRHEWPTDIRFGLQLAQADTLFSYRKFEESNALNNSVVPDWDWQVIGPFTNVEGSGFIEATPIETGGFDPKKTFKNENDTEFTWIRRLLRAPGSSVLFDDLPHSNGYSTYYANTFVTVPTERKVQMRISRHEPMKVWLDDRLVASFPKVTAFLPDAQLVSFVLPAGAHRLLVKISEFPEEAPNSKVKISFNDVEKEEGEGIRPQFGGYEQGNAGNYRGMGSNGFQLRLIDPATGNLFSDIKSSFTGTYSPKPTDWNVSVAEREYLGHFRQKVESNPKDLSAYYLLAKSFARYEAWEEGEEYFVRLVQKNPQSAFFKFLLAKFYDANDKGEKAESFLNEMDTSLMPTFAEHFLRLEKIDREQNEPEYLSMLEKMLKLTPTNYGILSQYLEHLKEKGKKDQVKSYVKQFLDTNRDKKWKERFEDYLKDDSYKPESYKPLTDKEREKNFKDAQKNLKKRFDLADYNTVAEYYRTRDKVSDVLKTYDEILRYMPWNDNKRLQKARYLFEKERSDEALAILKGLLETSPYSDDVYETIGDIYIEQKNEAEALLWYRKAEKIGNSRWNGGSLTEKIEKLDNHKKYNGYFESINLEGAAKDLSWASKYKDEESVISLFAQQLTYIEDEHKLEALRKMVIHIQNDAGAKSWTEGDFRQMGRITSAKILKKDGTVTSPDVSYNFAVFKNLQAGDVIFIEGSSESVMPDEIPGEYLSIDVLSWRAPVAKATYDLLVPKSLDLYFTCNRLDCNYTVRDTGAFKMMKWHWTDIAKLQDEEAMPNNLDQFAYMMTGSVPDWSRVIKWYNRKTYCRTDPNYEVLDKARELIKPGMSQEKIVETLHTFITKDINYSFVPFLNTNHVPKKPGATLSGKVGDCKDVATLMITLLRENGIPAWFTLAETHSFSRQEPRPTLYVFNHAIVAYQLKDGEMRFADLTTDYYPNGIVPEFDSDAWGLVVKDGETKLYRLPDHALDPTRSRVEITAKAVVDQEENITLEVNSVNRGCPGGRWREILIPATPEDRRKKLSEYYGGGVLTHLDFESIDFANLDETNEPLRAKLRMKGFNQLDKVSNFWIMPLPLPLSTPTQKALFAARRYNDLDLDVLFELAPVSETVELTLPAGFSLLEMPQNQQFHTRFGDYSLTFEPIAGGMRIKREVSFKNRYISYLDFQEFKKFYLNMLDADDSKVALKRG